MKPGKYTPSQIADWFLCSADLDAGAGITHLKLQKLVYYAQVWSLAFFDRPLFEEDIEAWAFGPVVRSLFRRFKGSGWQNLKKPAKCPTFDTQTEELLKEINRVYGCFDAKYLERLTHQEEPWKKARVGLAPEEASENIITKEEMKKFYKKLYQEASDKEKHTV